MGRACESRGDREVNNRPGFRPSIYVSGTADEDDLLTPRKSRLGEIVRGRLYSHVLDRWTSLSSIAVAVIHLGTHGQNRSRRFDLLGVSRLGQLVERRHAASSRFPAPLRRLL